jgi:hypothetical protein
MSDDHYASRRLHYLEVELRKLNAHLGRDGKVYDRNGREVSVWEESGGFGCQPTEEMLRADSQRREEALRQLRKRSTVIELPYFGPIPC